VVLIPLVKEARHGPLWQRRFESDAQLSSQFKQVPRELLPEQQLGPTLVYIRAPVWEAVARQAGSRTY
jgi:hypothetical protein